MNVNDDFSQKVVVHPHQVAWEGTLSDGVRRRRLDRVVGDLDRATTIVECAEKSAFSYHQHMGGEELLVLEGELEDDYGKWPAGSYLRHPAGSTHSPHTDTGCVLLVKHCQFDPNDETFICTNINKLEYVETNNRGGVTAASLYRNEHETVRVERWKPNAKIEFTPEGGAEILVIEGSALENDDEMKAQSWLRVPVGSQVSVTAGPEGTLVWVKTNHLKHQ